MELFLSDDGQLLVLDRFDLQDDRQRLGFEDIAALMGLSVRDTLSDRKYMGSCEAIADALKTVNETAPVWHSGSACAAEALRLAGRSTRSGPRV